MGLFQKVMTHKLCQNANFENGGTTIQVTCSILHVLLNILSKSSLRHTTRPQFRNAKIVFSLKKIDKMQVAD